MSAPQFAMGDAQVDAVPAPKLLFVSSDKFKPFRVDVRILFAQELVARGYQIDWLLQSDAACAADYVTPWGGGTAWVGKTDLGTGRLARLRKHLWAIANELRMLRFARAGRYDAILVKDKFIAALLALAAGRLSRTPLVYWLSYPFPEESLLLAQEGTARYPVFYWLRGLFFHLLLYKVILPRARHVFVQSEQMKQDVAAKGISIARMTPVPMGVDLSRIPYVEHAPVANGTGRPTILYLGTLIKVRRLDFLVRVLARVKETVPNVRLLFVGEGDDASDRAVLDAEVVRCGVADAVEFTGFMPMESAWRLVADADICVSPFYPTPILNSTSPTKLIEYMAMAKPVVANDHPEQKLVISESGAGLCVPWDEAAFAAAVIELLRDPQRAAEMGVQGRRYVERVREYGRIASLVDAEFRRHLPRSPSRPVVG